MTVSPLSTRLPAPSQPELDTQVTQKAKEFEAAYLGMAFEGMLADAMPAPAGGFGEEMFRSVLSNSLAEAVVEAGGIGLSRTIEAQIREYVK